MAYRRVLRCCLKKNQNAPRPSEHPPVRGGKLSKRLVGGIIGCKYKTSSWHLNGFPDGNNIDWVNSSITGFSGNSKTQRLYRHRKAPPRWVAERRSGDRANDLRVTASTAEGSVTALRVAGARRISKKVEMPSPTRRAEIGASTSVGVRSTLRLHTAGAWSTGLTVVRSEELMLVKINVPVNHEVGMVGVTIRAARGDGKKEWDSDSGASFHISHKKAEMTAYKRAPAGTTVELADWTILPVDGFGTVEVDLDQPGTTTKPVKTVSAAYVCVRTFAEPAVHP